MLVSFINQCPLVSLVCGPAHGWNKPPFFLFCFVNPCNMAETFCGAGVRQGWRRVVSSDYRCTLGGAEVRSRRGKDLKQSPPFNTLVFRLWPSIDLTVRVCTCVCGGERDGVKGAEGTVTRACDRRQPHQNTHFCCSSAVVGGRNRKRFDFYSQQFLLVSSSAQEQEPPAIKCGGRGQKRPGWMSSCVAPPPAPP